MKKPGAWFLFFLVIAFAAPVGAVMGLLVGRTWNAGGFAQWRRLPDLPLTPVQIVGGTTTQVFVRVADGQVYSCSTEQGECWVQDDNPPPLMTANDDCEQYPVQYTVSDAPGKVVDSLQIQWCHFEAGAEANYVILEDGSVWMWYHSDANFLNVARSFGAIGAGCGAGLLVGVVLLLYVWSKSRVLRSR